METQPEADDNVRLSRAAADTLRKLPEPEARAVAEAINRIGTARRRPLKIPHSESGSPFYALVSRDEDAPVVIYRMLTPEEGGGILITAIIDRDEYRGYLRAEEKGILRTPAAQALLGVAADTVK